MGKKILLGSTNRHKYEELRHLFSSFSGELLFGGDYQKLSVEEAGSSYEENALLKARAWSKATALPAVADDSGLEVESLEGAPGIYSARKGRDDGERMAWLLSAMEGERNRKARFVACLAYCDIARNEEFTAHGYCYGSIGEIPRGNCGFGYDPLFIPLGYDDTLGVLGEAVKSKISHRNSATLALLRILREENVL